VETPTRIARRRRILVLNGPDPNLDGAKGSRPSGGARLEEIERRVITLGAKLGVQVTCTHTDSEEELVTLVRAARSGDALIINPGRAATGSPAVRAAMSAVRIPCVEVHVDSSRALIAPVTAGFICGCGPYGYELALQAVVQRFR
jgi:3-dehydroquinate dehydratase-2